MRKILFSLRRLPSFLKNLGRRIRKAKRTLAFGVIILLLAQVLTVIGYSYAADVKGRGAVSDYGVYSQLEKLLEEKNKRKGSVDAESEERFKEIENEIANFKLRDEDIAQPSTFLEKEASATIGDVNLVTAPPKGAPLPDIFYRAAHDKYKGTEDTIFDNLLANLTRYFIYTEFFPDNNSNGDHFDEPPVKKWTSADFLPSFFNPDQGFKPDLWNGVNIDYNEATGDGDKGFFDEILGSYEEGSDVWVQLRPVIPLIEDILNNPFTKALQLLMQLITDGGELNLTAGFMIEIKKDSEWVNTEREMPLHIALVRGVAYDDLEFNRHEYIWTADFNFSETPQEFNFTVMVEGLSLEINDALALIYELLGLQEPQQSYTFTNIYPPYTVRYNLRNNTNQPNVEENTIENLSLLIGYEKFLKKQGEITRSLVDRTWAKVGVDSYKPHYNYIPRILQIRLFGEKNIIKQLTEYDSITYYAKQYVKSLTPANIALP
ncbi:MAG TPA: hypothetical protein EYP29_05145, partial [Thermoplasmata archaeon]|nr:hypothetical protein [Thermoplasmata archaeon]